MVRRATNPAHAVSDVEVMRAVAEQHFVGAASGLRQVASAIPFLSFIRFSAPTEMTQGILAPSMCLNLQGRKKVLIGTSVTQYGVGGYLLSTVDMPLSGQVLEASSGKPYLGLKIDFDTHEIAALIIDMQLAAHRPAGTAPGACVKRASADMEDACRRLVQLLASPADIFALAPLLKKEILYRLLTDGSGAVLYPMALSDHRANGVLAAIQWIKGNFAKPLSIDRLAREASMSASVLHRRFKEVTVMSPLQYQKQLRLLEARKLLLGSTIEAATVGFRVGYESPSQFSREYRRLFGASPLEDVRLLRERDLI
jgi:AraC-like DNA-binding protein